MFKKSFFFRYLSPYTGRIIVNTFLRVIAAVFTMLLLLCVAPILSLLFGQIGGISMVTTRDAISESVIQSTKEWVQLAVNVYGSNEALAIVCGVLLFCFFLKNLFGYLGLYYFNPIRNGAVESLRNDLFEKLMVLPLSFFKVHRKGDLISRLSGDIQEIDENVLKQIQQVLTDATTTIFLVIVLLMISPSLTLVVVCVLPIAGFATGFFSKTLRRSSPEQQASLGRLISQMEEGVEGIKTLRSYNTTTFSINRFKEENNIYNRIKVGVSQRVDLGSPVSEVVGTLAIVCILICGGYYILGKNSVLSPEAFITYLLTLTQILLPAKNLTTAYYSLQRGKGSVNRIKEILYADEVVVEKQNAFDVKEFKDSIEWRSVSFKYGDCEVLHGINLIIPKGKYIALVGPSGGGKSTLVNMVPRFYDCSEGEVLIDGKNIQDAKIDNLRSLTSLVSQDTILFNDTIYDNILLGKRSATEEEVKEAAKRAHAYDFIMATENGFDTVIGDSGTKLSGGQRQRISIARALLKNAPILIFDEASSALDTQAESIIQKALEYGTKGNSNQTIISIAHRLSSIRHADEIIVIDKGEIVERGTHESLLKENGLYTKLCQMQNLE